MTIRFVSRGLCATSCPLIPGIWTGSIYGDQSLTGMGFRGEVTSTNVIVVKSHVYNAPDQQNRQARKYDKVLHLIRNPFDAMPAERKRLVQYTNSHTGQPEWDTFVNGKRMRGDELSVTAILSWDLWMEVYAQRWQGTLAHALRYEEWGKASMLLKYEDLKKGTRDTLAGALRFLGVALGVYRETCMGSVRLLASIRERHAFSHICDSICTQFFDAFLASAIRTLSLHDLCCIFVCADVDPALAQCVATGHTKTHRVSLQSPYPSCMYTKAQLERLMILLQPSLSAHNYSVPKACTDVLAGKILGGTDALPAVIKDVGDQEAEIRYRKSRCRGSRPQPPSMCKDLPETEARALTI